jgi:hypothetical protein
MPLAVKSGFCIREAGRDMEEKITTHDNEHLIPCKDDTKDNIVN